MVHRIFVAINLPDEAKDQLLAFKEKWSDLPARWVDEANLHLTLAFLGNTSDQELVDVCMLMKQVGERHDSFPITFTKIMYGPPGKTPRMIWTIPEESFEFLAIRKDIEEVLADSDNISYHPEKRPKSPHLTLARLNLFELRRFDTEEIPDITEEISVSFSAESVDVMQSTLKRFGAEYSVCQSVPLCKK